MSKQSGYIVFKATPEMVRQIPNVFKKEATYVAREASVVSLGPNNAKQENEKTSTEEHSTPKNNGRKINKFSKSLTKNTKPTKSNTTPKHTKRSPIKPDIIVDYVKDNEGCNMADIEVAIELPQSTIRRILNSARKSGTIRTEGQRRGLRYFGGKNVGVGDVKSVESVINAESQ